MIKVHDLTPAAFRYNQRDLQYCTMISDYCQVGGINFLFDESSYLCEVELPITLDETMKSNLLDYIDWDYLAKNASKKIVLTHRIIYNLEDFREKLNEISLKYNLSERLFWYTFNPLDFKLKDKCKFKLLFLDSLTNVFFESRISMTFWERQLLQDPNKFHKYQYGFEPELSNFKKLDISKCDKYFMSSNRNAKAHRLLSTYLINKNIDSDKGIITYHGLNDRHLNMQMYLENHQTDLNKYGINLQKVLDFSSFRGVNFNDNIESHPFDGNLRPSYLDAYEKCLISYVNESTSNQSEIFVTEKTWINYAHGKPFILNANKNMLTWLDKYYGFKSFPMLFDESYDNKDTFVDRVFYGVEELTKFCSLSFEDAKSKVKEIQKILNHNFKVFYSLNHKNRFRKIFDKI